MFGMVTQNQPLTMSSREIAKLTKKQHAHVKRDIENMCAEINHPNLDSSTYEHRGNVYVEYLLDKNLTLCLVSGYNAKLRIAIINRWQELEEATQKQVPQTFSEALMLAAKQAEEIDSLNVRLEDAVRTKAQISDKRTATLKNKASQDSKRIKKLEDKLQDVGDYQSIIAAGLPQKTKTELNPDAATYAVLRTLSRKMGYEIHEVPCPRYGKAKTYHIDVIEEYKKTYMN